MRDFSRRSTETEWMDDPAAPENELWQNLRELEVVNEYLGGYRVILDVLGRMEWRNGKARSVLDLGSGGGDTLRAIAKWAVKHKRAVRLAGVDRNPVMTQYATAHSTAFPGIRFITRDIFDPELDDQRADIVMCSLFCHHFEHGPLVRLVQRMRDLSLEAVVINDLHRHWFAYYSIAWLTAVFSKTYMVKNDAKVSVARAFSRQDLRQLMSDAGVKRYSLRWRWAFRWELIIPKDQ